MFFGILMACGNTQIEPKMQPVPGHANLFNWDGRTLQLTGRRKAPILLKDDKTGQVLWDKAKNTKFTHSWARHHFKISSSGDAVTITDKQRDSVVCECVGVDHSEGDPFLMQVCVSETRHIVACLHFCCTRDDNPTNLLACCLRNMPLSVSALDILRVT